MLVVVLVAYVYFTLWTVVINFVDARHAVHDWFPDPYWGLALPVSAYVVGLSISVGVYIRIMQNRV